MDTMAGKKSIFVVMILVSLLLAGISGTAHAKAEFIMKVASEPPPVL